jgi:hypothetical protein
MQCVIILNNYWLMLFKEIITVYSEIHTKHTSAFHGQNAELLVVK